MISTVPRGLDRLVTSCSVLHKVQAKKDQIYLSKLQISNGTQAI